MAIKAVTYLEDHHFSKKQRWIINLTTFGSFVILHPSKIDPYDVLALVFFRIQH